MNKENKKKKLIKNKVDLIEIKKELSLSNCYKQKEPIQNILYS